jgi:peptidoglycan/xylan/chitin deacetylase (PgdA/CDA1 family)
MPKGKKCAFVYNLDIDGPSLWLGGGYASGAPYFGTTVSKGEFGPREGLPRLLDILDRLDLKVSFGIPGHTALSYPEICKRVVAEGHEVCYHGFIHEATYKLTREQEEAVMIKGLATLKDVLGVTPKGYINTSFEISPNTNELIEKYGFLHCLTQSASEFFPYRLRVGDVVTLDGPIIRGRETKVLEIPFNYYMDDFPHFDFIYGTQTGLQDPEKVFGIFRSFFNYMYEKVPGGVMRMMAHPQVSGHAHIVSHVESMLKYVQSHRDVWMARAIDIASAYED